MLTQAMPPTFLNLAVMHPLYLVALVGSDALHDQTLATEETWAARSSHAAWTVHPCSPTLLCSTHREGYFLWLSVSDLALGDKVDDQ